MLEVLQSTHRSGYGFVSYTELAEVSGISVTSYKTPRSFGCRYVSFVYTSIRGRAQVFYRSRLPQIDDVVHPMSGVLARLIGRVRVRDILPVPRVKFLGRTELTDGAGMDVARNSQNCSCLRTGSECRRQNSRKLGSRMDVIDAWTLLEHVVRNQARVDREATCRGVDW